MPVVVRITLLFVQCILYFVWCVWLLLLCCRTRPLPFHPLTSANQTSWQIRRISPYCIEITIAVMVIKRPWIGLLKAVESVCGESSRRVVVKELLEGCVNYCVRRLWRKNTPWGINSFRCWRTVSNVPTS